MKLMKVTKGRGAKTMAHPVLPNARAIGDGRTVQVNLGEAGPLSHYRMRLTLDEAKRLGDALQRASRMPGIG